MILYIFLSSDFACDGVGYWNSTIIFIDYEPLETIKHKAICSVQSTFLRLNKHIARHSQPEITDAVLK